MSAFEDYVNANLGIRKPLISDFAPPTGVGKSTKTAGIRGSHFIDLNTNFLYEKTGENNDVDWVKIAKLGDSRGGGGSPGGSFACSDLYSCNVVFTTGEQTILGYKTFGDGITSSGVLVSGDVNVSGDIQASGLYPPASGIGQIGSPDQPWGSGYFKSLDIIGEDASFNFGEEDGDNIFAVFTGSDGRYKIAAGELSDEELGNVTEFFTISGGNLLIDATGGRPNHLYVSGNIDASGIYPYASGKGQIGSPEKPWGSGFFTSIEIKGEESELSIGDVDGDNIFAVFTGSDGRYRIAMGELTDDELLNARHFVHISGGDVLIDASGTTPSNLNVSGDIVGSGFLPTSSGQSYVGKQTEPFGEGYFNNIYSNNGAGSFQNINPVYWEEAFEEDANGDLMPVQGIHINDNTWGLNENNELYLKANYFKPNFGPPMNIIGGDAYFDFENLFTEDVTF